MFVAQFPPAAGKDAPLASPVAPPAAGGDGPFFDPGEVTSPSPGVATGVPEASPLPAPDNPPPPSSFANFAAASAASAASVALAAAAAKAAASAGVGCFWIGLANVRVTMPGDVWMRSWWAQTKTAIYPNEIFIVDCFEFAGRFYEVIGKTARQSRAKRKVVVV